MAALSSCRRSRRIGCLGGVRVVELVEQALDVERPGDHRETTVLVAGPLISRPVGCQLDAVAVGVAQVERLGDAVVGGAVYGVFGVQEPAEGLREVPTLGIQNGEVEESGGIPRGWGRVLAHPSVQADVVMVASG